MSAPSENMIHPPPSTIKSMPMQKPMNHNPDAGHALHSMSPRRKLIAPLTATHPQFGNRVPDRCNGAEQPDGEDTAAMMAIPNECYAETDEPSSMSVNVCGIVAKHIHAVCSTIVLLGCRALLSFMFCQSVGRRYRDSYGYMKGSFLRAACTVREGPRAHDQSQ